MTWRRFDVEKNKIIEDAYQIWLSNGDLEPEVRNNFGGFHVQYHTGGYLRKHYGCINFNQFVNSNGDLMQIGSRTGTLVLLSEEIVTQFRLYLKFIS